MKEVRTGLGAEGEEGLVFYVMYGVFVLPFFLLPKIIVQIASSGKFSVVGLGIAWVVLLLVLVACVCLCIYTFCLTLSISRSQLKLGTLVFPTSLWEDYCLSQMPCFPIRVCILLMIQQAHQEQAK